ncbi:ParM/StbA family protein (plasmid) [Shewanella xiamenensis]|uniref:ParM/StbA family protein n=1 Tax=Shewanella xiamenensis TaxID=332186 RepID=A0ABT6UJ19_9GAMM|nr:ParM/StbA family protein [Shewanella xiamenensis]MDI5833279.1 ParM/StbA family protein [Shewanella xiamenensis]WHF57971.1 ParM/StbA family protein [Shewanella xiamenensis]
MFKNDKKFCIVIANKSSTLKVRNSMQDNRSSKAGAKVQDDEPLLVAVDNGHYGIKVYAGIDKQKGYIESRCRIGGSVSTSLMATTENGAGKELVFSTDGIEYTTGSVQASPTTFTEYPLSPINRVLVHSALHQSGFSGKDINVVLGLPYNQYYDPNTDSGKNEQLINGMEDNVKTRVVHDDLDEISIVNAKTVPEGMAAWFSYIMKEVVNDKGKVIPVLDKERANQTVVLIDIGGQTTEVVTVVGQKVQATYSSSFGKGSHRVLEDLKRFLLQESRVQNISDSKVKQALRDGKITIGGNLIDCTKVIRSSRMALVHEIKAHVDTLTNDIEGDIDCRLLLGGTSVDLFEHFRDWKNAQLMEEPVYANAIGGYLFIKYLN